MAHQDITFDRYANVHKSPQGPGDARPTALQIIEDEGVERKFTDKTILVTGGSSGIGIETVRALAHTGAHIVVGVRNTAKGQKVLDHMVTKDNSVESSQLELLEMDFDSLDSVRSAAKNYLSKHKQLNILVLNAGMLAAHYWKHPDLSRCWRCPTRQNQRLLRISLWCESSGSFPPIQPSQTASLFVIKSSILISRRCGELANSPLQPGNHERSEFQKHAV